MRSPRHAQVPPLAACALACAANCVLSVPDPIGHAPRLLQAAATTGQLNQVCYDALVAENKDPPRLASCVQKCLSGANKQPWLNSGQWTPALVDAATLLPSSSSDSCVSCVSTLVRCNDNSNYASAGDEGWGSRGIDLGADTFTCDGTIGFANATGPSASAVSATSPKLYLDQLCFPGVCSYLDIRDLFQYDLVLDSTKIQGNALAYRAAASCDLLATFLDSSAPWWILVFAVLWVIGNIFLSRCAPAMLLKCALWLYIGYDVLVGGGQLFFGLFVLFKQRIPEFIKVSMPFMGMIQMFTGLVARCALMSEVEIKTGICSWNPFRGKYWVLYASNAFAAVHGLLSLTLGFVFQIGGKDSLESALTVNNDEDYSKLELDNLHATVQTYHTLMVCMFFISAGVQACLVTLSTGCPCWDGFGGIKEKLVKDLQFHRHESVSRVERAAATSEREASAFVNKHRAKAMKQAAKSSAARP